MLHASTCKPSISQVHTQAQVHMVHNYLGYSNAGEFGIVYKAQLTHWHGEGLPKAVAVKTLKGKISAIMNMQGVYQE